MEENLEVVIAEPQEDIVVEEVSVEDLEGTVSVEDLLNDTVSGGDAEEPLNGSGGVSSLSVEDIADAIDLNGTEVYVIQEYTLWDKPLAEYSVTEGLLLIIALCLIAGVIHKVIGGVLNCTALLRR